MDAYNIILVSMDVLQLSIGVGPSIWGTKTTEFASDKKKVFETFFYTENSMCFSKRNSDWIFFKKFFMKLKVVSYFQDAFMSAEPDSWRIPITILIEETDGLTYSYFLFMANFLIFGNFYISRLLLYHLHAMFNFCIPNQYFNCSCIHQISNWI